MNIDDFLDKVEGKDKAELLQIIKSDLDCLLEVAEYIESASNGEITKDDMFKADGVFGYFISLASFIDGRIDTGEYEFAKELFSYLGYELSDIGDVRELAQNLTQAGYLEDTIKINVGWCKFAEDSEGALNAILELCSCIFACNGAIDSKEVEFLNTMIYYYENEDEDEDGDDETEEYDASMEMVLDSSEDSYVEREPDRQPILSKHNGIVTRNDDYYYLSIGAEIINPNMSRVACNTAVKIIVKDNNGRIVKSYNDTIYCIDSNGIFYYGVEMYIDNGVPSNYQIQLCTDSFVNGPECSTIAKGITFSHYSTNTDRWGTTTFTSNVHNSYEKKLRINAYFVFYDKAGNISGGTQGWVGEVFPNSDDNIETCLRTSAERSVVKASADFDFFELL